MINSLKHKINKDHSDFYFRNLEERRYGLGCGYPGITFPLAF